GEDRRLRLLDAVGGAEAVEQRLLDAEIVAAGVAVDVGAPGGARDAKKAGGLGVGPFAAGIGLPEYLGHQTGARGRHVLVGGAHGSALGIQGWAAAVG